MELRPVAHRRFHEGQAKFPGGADSRRRGVKGADRLRGQVGLQASGLLPGEELQPGNAVFHPPAVELLHLGPVLLAEGQHKGTAAAVRYIQPLAQPLGQLHPPDVEAGHKSPRLWVIAGVENGRVGFGGSHGHVVFPLQNGNVQLVFGKLEGGGRTRNAAADDQHVIHRKLLPGTILSHQRCFAILSYQNSGQKAIRKPGAWQKTCSNSTKEIGISRENSPPSN